MPPLLAKLDISISMGIRTQRKMQKIVENHKISFHRISAADSTGNNKQRSLGFSSKFHRTPKSFFKFFLCSLNSKETSAGIGLQFGRGLLLSAAHHHAFLAHWLAANAAQTNTV